MRPDPTDRPLRSRPPSRALDTVLAALNGIVGDYLHRRGNGLATACEFFHRGRPLELAPEPLRRSLPRASGRIAVWLHGLCVDEGVWTVPRAPERSFPDLLEEELGFTPVFLRYNSGRHVSENGELLAEMIEELLAYYPVPVEEVALVGFSMGGLVIRSACHVGAERGHAWLRLVRRAIYIGVPHLGTPVERLGRVVAWGLRTLPNGYSHLFASLADLRSAGIQDMGNGRILREHWEGSDPAAPLHHPHHPLPLLPGIRHGLIAGRLREGQRDLLSALLGDGMVPIGSASAGLHQQVGIGADRLRIVPGVSHLGLTRHPEVWAQIRSWCTAEGR